MHSFQARQAFNVNFVSVLFIEDTCEPFLCSSEEHLKQGPIALHSVAYNDFQLKLCP